MSSLRYTARRVARRSLALGVVLTALVACSSQPQGWKRLGQKDLQELLPQMLLSEAVYDQRGLPDSLRVLGYQKLLGQRGYSLVDWDSSVVWYGRYRAEDYKKSYEYAMAVLTSQQEGLQRRIDSLARIEARQRAWQTGALDSVNLLRDSLSRHQLGGYLERSFSLTPEFPYASGTDVRFAVRLQGFSPRRPAGTLRLQLRLQFADSTQRVLDLKPLKPGLNVLSFTLPEGKRMQSAQGILRGVAPRGKGKYLVVDSFSFARFSGGASPAMALPDEAPTASLDTLTDGATSEDDLTF